jgi:DNA-binding NtrC family response regulator
MSTDENLIRVLHVEDSRTGLFLVKNLLKGISRYQITQTDTFAKAKTILGQSTFDILLLDLSLPDAQGIDLLHSIEESAPGVPVIAVTGEEDKEFGLQVMREGAQSCLLKSNLQQKVLIEAIDHAIEQKRAETTHRGQKRN